MDQNVIGCLKTYYRKRLVKLMLRHLDRDQSVPKIAVLKALQLPVSHRTSRTKLQLLSAVNVVNDEDDPFKDLNADLDELRQKEPSFLPKDLTAKIVTATNTNVLTRASTIPDKEILKEVIIEEMRK